MRRFLLAALIATPGFAQEKAPAGPRITAIVPLEVVPGTAVTLRLRGLKLVDTSALEFPDAASRPIVEIKEKKKADLPNGLEAKDAGDTQVEVQLTVPADWQPGTVSFRVITGSESTPVCKLHIVEAAALVEEKEPNGSFREAQPIDFGKIVRGAIKEDKDVDVFKFTGHAKTRIRAGIVAAQHASLLDSTLNLYDAAGHLLATNDDGAIGRDSLLEFSIPAEGTYFLSVTDASDRGGPWSAYELNLKELP
ncbi:MAG: hypothetical protein JWL59_1970 [Chthoniobacteraceae bacterium]|nr:hypothetical protein [Chthoniobacteraceae bacterium]